MIDEQVKLHIEGGLGMKRDRKAEKEIEHIEVADLLEEFEAEEETEKIHREIEEIDKKLEEIKKGKEN
ncbi:hypothetical protein PM10SUCC1_02280 [Propionigenium maris DSM 9537]|uniref:Uncharacterized protein n=2 Tax=Propionigenium TaxID=2332 RepID=A0A9W6GGA0_9FUSO|nr:hypothetical protein PM10SUCC1_02280 [Propionigenium maris DSM 9537]